MRNNKSDKSLEKAVLKYLEKGKGRQGKSLFDKWAKDMVPIYCEYGTDTSKKDELRRNIKSGIDEKIFGDGQPGTEGEIRNLPFVSLLKVAACILLVISIGATFYLFYGKPQSISGQISPAIRVNVPLGQKDTIFLSDGTKVYLNAGTSFSYPGVFNGRHREVSMSGEAFFQVKRMEDCPFIVRSGGIKTTVLGTSFNVRAYPAEKRYQVAVSTGKVLVESSKDKPLLYKENKVILLPDQKIEISGESPPVKVTRVDIDKIAGWKNGVLVLDQLSIGDIAEKLEQWYGIPVEINNGGIKDITFVGRFKNPELKDVLESMKYTVGVDYKIYGNHVFIGKSKK